VGVLLLVLAFTVGIGVGRSGGGRGSGTPSLSREAAARGAQPATLWVLRGEIPRIDSARGDALPPARIVRELSERFEIPEAQIRVDASGEPIWVSVGPFASERDALVFYEAKRLETARVGSAAPFRFTRPERLAAR
jgi:hypothetical protein